MTWLTENGDTKEQQGGQTKMGTLGPGLPGFSFR